MRFGLLIAIFLVALVVAEANRGRGRGPKNRCGKGGRGNRGGRGGRLGPNGGDSPSNRGRGLGNNGRRRHGGKAFGYGGRGLGGSVFGGFGGGRKGYAYGWGRNQGRGRAGWQGGEGGNETDIIDLGGFEGLVSGGGEGEGEGGNRIDLIFVLDSSASVKQDNYRRELNFVRKLAKRFRVGSDDRIRVGCVAFSNSGRKIFGLGDSQNPDDVDNAIRGAPFLKSRSKLFKGLQLVIDDDLFGSANGGRDDARKIIIFFTDGKSPNRGRTISVARRLRKRGVEILPIGIGRASISELRGCANVDNNVFRIRNFLGLDNIEDQVVDRVFEVEEEEPLEPEEEEPDFPVLADLLFILDSAGDISADLFAGQRGFAAGLSRRFVLGPEAAQLAALFYSNEVGRLFDLFDYYDTQVVSDILNATDFIGNSRDTELALSFANEIFRTDRGDREFARDIIVIWVGGKLSNAANAAAEAAKLRGKGIRIICVGFGGADQAELDQLADGPDDIFWLLDLADTEELQESVADRIADLCEREGEESVEEEEPEEEVEEVLPPTEAPPPPPPPPPSCADEGSAVCQHGCEDSEEGYVCVCNPGYEPWPLDVTKCQDIDECEYNPPVCQHNCLNTEGSFICSCDEGFVVSEEDNTQCNEVEICHLLGDIIFVLDSSGSVGEVNFESQKEFIRRISRHFTIGETDARFGCVVFSYYAEKLFDLIDYSTPEEVDEAISNVPWMRSLTYTNKALDLVRTENMYSAENGGRDAASDIIILVTDGASTDSAKTLAAAQQLKDSGVLIICLGIGDSLDVDELNAVASSPDDVLIADSFDVLPVVEQRVADRTCQKGSA